MFGKYAGFIVPAYIASAFVIAALTVWIALVYRKRQNEIADLEARGIRRASAEKAK